MLGRFIAIIHSSIMAVYFVYLGIFIGTYPRRVATKESVLSGVKTEE